MDASTWVIALAVPALMLLGMLGTVIALLWRSSSYVTRMEMAAERVGRIEQRLEMIPALEQRIVFVEEWVKRIEGRHDSTRAHAIRAEAHSQGRFGE